MNLIVAIGAGIFIGLGVFFLSRIGSATNPPKQTETLTGRELNATIPDIVGRGQSLECDWKLPITAGPNPFNKGKLWTTAGKGRSSVTGVANGVSIESNALYQSSVIYSWTSVEGQKVGIKFSPENIAEQINSMSAEERQQAEQTRSNMLISCQPWTPDETKFSLPSDVEFREL